MGDGSLQVVTETPFEIAYIPGRMRFPKHSLTVIVKGTFELVPNGLATPAVEQLGPTGDEPHPDDEEGTGSPRYSSDFAPFKPRADLLLSASCHQPFGKAGGARRVAFGVGAHRKELVVQGDRTWPAGFTVTPPAPAPFTTMDLRWERAFGGAGQPLNPLGRGATNLPNVEDPRDLVTGPKSRPAPAGFGPIPASWPQRHRLTGTYDQRWLNKRWPWFPKNFDFGYFNAAPIDQQVPYLKGNEQLTFENLHPEHDKLRTQLPGIRIRCWVNEARRRWFIGQFHEVTMHLDTLWVDVSALTVVLTWRGFTPIRDEDYEEITHLFVRAEGVDEKRVSTRGAGQLFRGLLDRMQIEEEYTEGGADTVKVAEGTQLVGSDTVAIQPLEDMGSSTIKLSGTDADTLLEDSRLAKEVQELRAVLEKAGIDPDTWLNPPAPSAAKPAAPTPEELTAAFEAMGIDPEAGMAALAAIDEEEPSAPEPEAPDPREAIRADLAAGRSLSDRDLSNLDLRGMSFAGADLRGAILSRCRLDGVSFEGAKLELANLSGSRLERANFTQALLTGADLTECDLSRAQLCGANLDDAVLTGADLSGADLRGCSALAADFEAAKLVGAVFADATLIGAELGAADLQRVDFCGADLSEASLQGALAMGASFSGATLNETRLGDGCDLRAARLSGITARGSIWEQANLTEADLSFADLTGADFTRARLDGVDARALEARGARFVRASLRGANLV